ncbi:hypothetical protein C8R45DRAFT_1207790 [Mycena sanguinolenta]|nr:hypothetical protein C8R45DRAFT_1207790 [Mycena sanguinolenta]
MVLTRCAYRESMEISRWLPNEVLADIIQHSPKVDQASLSRVSRLFHNLCLPVLYSIIEIRHPDICVLFVSAIVENPSRADLVRSFAVDFSHDPTILPTPCSDLVLASLKLMPRLDHLFLCAFALDGRHAVILFEEFNFPQLTSCDIWAPWGTYGGSLTTKQKSDSVALFLARHSTLKRVHIHPAEMLVPSRSIRASLPNLQCYSGYAALIPTIDASGLQSAHLNWFNNADTEEIILAISLMAKPDFPFVFSHTYLGDPRDSPLNLIVTSMSKHIPHTRILRLRSLTATFEIAAQDAICHVTKCLPHFTDLVYLTMEWGINPSTADNLLSDMGRTAVEGWGNACPTLEACRLNHYAWRKDNGRWEECPINKFRVLVGPSESR